MKRSPVAGLIANSYMNTTIFRVIRKNVTISKELTELMSSK